MTKTKPGPLIQIGLGIFILYLAIHYWDGVASFLLKGLDAASPLIWGGVLAYLINILMTFYEGHYFPKRSGAPAVKKSRRPVCLLLAFLTLLGIAAAVLSLVVPELIAAVQLIIDKVQQVVVPLTQNDALMELMPKELVEFLNAVDWESRLSQLATLITQGLGATVTAAADTAFSLLSSMITFLLSVIFSIYLLLGKEKLQDQCRRLMARYLKPVWNEKLTYVLRVSNDCFHHYIAGQCLEAAILGGLCTLGMLLLRLPYAPMIGALIGVTALIPVAGAYIGACVGAFLILTISPVKAAVFLVFLVVLQQLEGNIIYPKVVGSSIGLPAIWVLAAITVGGGLSGIFGMLIGVPIAAILYRILREDLHKKEGLPEGCGQDAEIGPLPL